MIVDEREYKELIGKLPEKAKDPMQDVMESIKALAKAMVETASNQKAPVVNIPKIEMPAPTVINPSTKTLATPTRWVFHVERDADGRLSKIVANPE
jgi:hypothetical protein